MPTIVPEKKGGSKKRSAEVQDFYRDRSKHGSKEIKVDHLHNRNKSFVEKIVSVWSEDQEKTNKPFTGFQNRIIELHNKKDKFGKDDPEDAKRLLAFLTIFSENDYGDDEIKLLSNGTFKNQEEVDDLLARAFAGEKIGGFSDEQEMAAYARTKISQDLTEFRKAILPQGQIRLVDRLFLSDASVIRRIEEKEIEATAAGATNEQFARFNLEDVSAAGTKELIGFIEAGTSANIENLLAEEAKNKVSNKTDQISQAESKGYKGIAKASSQEHLEKLRQGGFNRHEDLVSGFNNLEDFLKYIHPDLTYTEGSKFDLVMAVALNDPVTLEAVNTYLNGAYGTPLDSSPDKILQVVNDLTNPQKTILATGLEASTVTHLQEGPWYLKVDAAHTFLERRLDQISGEGEILPKVEFNKLDLSQANHRHAAVLMAHGYRQAQLKDQKMSSANIKQAIKTYFVHDENGDLIPDADGKPQFKESQETADYNQGIEDARDAIDQDDIKDEYKGSLADDDPDVLKRYQNLTQAQARDDAINQLTAAGIEINDYNLNRILNTHVSKYWLNGLPVIGATNPNHNVFLNQSKDLVLSGKKAKKKVKKLHNEAMDQAEDKYKRENIKGTELADLGTVSLAGLIENDNAIDIEADDLPEPTKTEVETIAVADDFPTGSVDRLKDFITNNPHLPHGIDLSIVLAAFGDAIQQASLTSEMTDDQQQQLKGMVA